MPCRRFQLKASLSNLCFEFVAPKTKPKVLLNATCDITKGVKKEDFRPTSRSTCRLCSKKKKRIRGYKILDDSVIAYSANGKNRPIYRGLPSVHLCCSASFFFFFFFFFLFEPLDSTCAHKLFSRSARTRSR